MKNKTNSWSTNEVDFLQECFIIGLPLKTIRRFLKNRTSASINQKINNDGLMDIRDIHREVGPDCLIEKYKKRYLTGITPYTREPPRGKVVWHPNTLKFIRRLYFVGIPTETIADQLDVHWKTIIKETKPYRRRRDRFRTKFASRMYHHFIIKGRSYWYD